MYHPYNEHLIKKRGRKKKKRDMKAKSVCCRGQSENRILTENKKSSRAFKQKLWSADPNNKLHNVRFK